eukprot:gnl/TRDRNA2_/TRDRNA2_173732_c0_seq1.p1 gnl/TRDRNA2_/TRDRNA2_173732_c0~~gnl/TRDRNA2_/TRDRNA2_173732_c0_seq1.p1  ORF type:complete len:489 (+),score=143.04 gnl/TRDRNA2_/TRDRNA2_173732_c0_seq1:109-1575(+)
MLKHSNEKAADVSKKVTRANKVNLKAKGIASKEYIEFMERKEAQAGTKLKKQREAWKKTVLPRAEKVFEEELKLAEAREEIKRKKLKRQIKAGGQVSADKASEVEERKERKGKKGEGEGKKLKKQIESRKQEQHMVKASSEECEEKKGAKNKRASLQTKAEKGSEHKEVKVDKKEDGGKKSKKIEALKKAMANKGFSESDEDAPKEVRGFLSPGRDGVFFVGKDGASKLLRNERRERRKMGESFALPTVAGRVANDLVGDIAPDEDRKDEDEEEEDDLSARPRAQSKVVKKKRSSVVPDDYDHEKREYMTSSMGKPSGDRLSFSDDEYEKQLKEELKAPWDRDSSEFEEEDWKKGLKKDKEEWWYTVPPSEVRTEEDIEKEKRRAAREPWELDTSDENYEWPGERLSGPGERLSAFVPCGNLIGCGAQGYPVCYVIPSLFALAFVAFVMLRVKDWMVDLLWPSRHLSCSISRKEHSMHSHAALLKVGL